MAAQLAKAVESFELQRPWCPDCKHRGVCRNFNIHHREAIFASINGYPLQCVDYQANYWRGVDGVKP